MGCSSGRLWEATVRPKKAAWPLAFLLVSNDKLERDLLWYFLILNCFSP